MDNLALRHGVKWPHPGVNGPHTVVKGLIYIHVGVNEGLNAGPD